MEIEWWVREVGKSVGLARRETSDVLGRWKQVVG